MPEHVRENVFHYLLLAVAAVAIISPVSAGVQSSSPVSPQKAPTVEQKAEAARLNNLGVAYMDRQEFAPAEASFQKSHALDPAEYTPELNRGIALYRQQKMPDASAIFKRLVDTNAKDPHLWFNLGLLYRDTGHLEESVEAFSKAVELTGGDADALYLLGNLHAQQQQYDKAIADYKHVLAANPLHVSAEFGLAQAFRRKGDLAQAREHLQRFQQLMQKKLGAPVSQIYGEEGRLSLAQPMLTAASVPAAINVKFVPVTLPMAAVAKAANSDDDFGSGVCVFDFDGDGQLDIFLANNGVAPALLRNLGNGQFHDVTAAAGIAANAPGKGCAFGDYDNDGKPDLAVTFPGRVALFHNEGGKFRDVSIQAGISAAGLSAGATFVDYDHEGNLDLYVTGGVMPAVIGGNIPSNKLWRNNANGTFTDVTESLKVAGQMPSFNMLASDLNNDRAIDLLVTTPRGLPTVFSNPREGPFQASQPWADSTAGKALAASILDFDKDGWMDIVFTHGESPALTLWRNVDGKRFEAVKLPAPKWKRAWGVVCFDYDNDGWIDIAALGEGDTGSELRVFRNRGKDGFEDVSAALGLDKLKLHNARALVAADIDGDRATDLVVTQLAGPAILLKNEGGATNNSVRVAFRGLADNKTGLGTKVEVFAGELHQKWEVSGSSYLSQGPPEIIAGLGKHKEADVVRIFWLTGVVQDEIQLASGKSHSVDEIDRRGSSCPILFAWNGDRFQLVTDVIGPAVIGHWVGPGQRNVADPDEYIKIDGDRVRTRNGYLSFRFAEPMEEVNYIDQVRLLAVDHPKDAAVFPNERFVSNPPFPDFKVIASRNAHLPKGAWDSSGKDVLPELRAIDHTYVTGFRLKKFSGFADSHALELDLGAWDSTRPLRLLMHGFTEYFTANSMYAAYKAGIEVVAPYLEAQDATGKWVRVIDDLGFPAGLPRTMVADLSGKIPAGTRRVRLVTNLQIYWDQILIDNEADSQAVKTEEVPLAKADVHFHGYPKSVEKHIPGDLDYIYEQVSLTGPYVRHEGTYTRYGDVLPLLKSVDDHSVIFGSGEEIKLDFDPSKLPPLPQGWTRDYFFYANGFVKDMDFYEADALTVHPLPFHAMPSYPYVGEAFPTDERSVEYQIDYNTRFQSADDAVKYRFEFPETKKKIALHPH